MENRFASRRNLLKAAFVSAAAPVAVAHAAELKPRQRWDMETDVVVIGYGGAGAAAALAAHDAKAEVLVLEKMAAGGGNTAASGGGFIIPTDAEKATDYLMRIFAFADNDSDETLVKTFSEGAVKLQQFFDDLGIRLRVYGHANYPQLPHADVITKYGVRGRKGGGVNLFEALAKCVETDRKVKVLYETSAKQLVRRGTEVVGVIAQQNGKDVRIRARKGVILTTGGFEFNEEMLKNFAQGTKISGIGNPGNTGDGLRMAMTMGAKLWHMTSYSCPLGIKVPGLSVPVPFAAFGPSYICVNQDGKRFVNEAGVDFHAWLYGVNTLDVTRHRYPAIPCYAVMDEATVKAGPLSYAGLGYASSHDGYKWSKDSEAEIAAGVVKKADTLDELAQLIRVPAGALKATVARWNQTVATGDDPDFGRRQKKDMGAKSTGLATSDSALVSAPLAANGPYYAVELWPTLLNTQGGPKRLPNAQLQDADGEPIGRLFAAGELGSIWGSFYQGSSNIAECLVFGQIAGRAAAGLRNWK